MELSTEHKSRLDDALKNAGLRSTRQREHVFSVLMKSSHPSVDEVFKVASREMPGISLATVYNCLESLVQCGLVHQFSLDRESSRFDPNLHQHAHFQCKETGKVYDIPIEDAVLQQIKNLLPAEFDADAIELTFRGSAPTIK